MVISKLGINLLVGYKTFFNLNFILTYNMYMPVLPSLFYFVPCNPLRNEFPEFWEFLGIPRNS